MAGSQTCATEFEKFWAEVMPHMDFGSHKAMVKFAFEHGYRSGEHNAPLPQSIQEALNSGDGTYRP